MWSDNGWNVDCERYTSESRETKQEAVAQVREDDALTRVFGNRADEER